MLVGSKGSTTKARKEGKEASMEKPKIADDKNEQLQKLLIQQREKSLERMVKIAKENEAERKTKFWFGEIGVILRRLILG